MVIKINYAKVYALASILKSIGLSKILDIELIDPQFISIKSLVKECKLKTPLLSYLNALISYKLSCKGELYWLEFSEFFKNDVLCNEYEQDPTVNVKDQVLRSFNEFLRMSKCNRIGVQAKLRRLIKVLGMLESLYSTILHKDFLKLWRLTYGLLKAKPESKTVVFSIKMAYYGLKALGQYLTPLPMNIPIPVDARIAKVTYSSRLLIGPTSWRELYVNIRAVVDVWNKIARLSLVPPLHIDSLIWLLLNKSLRSKFREILGDTLLSKLIRELGVGMLD